MDAVTSQLLTSIISGLVGGFITGLAAFSAIKVEMRYLRRDVDHAHARIDEAVKMNGKGRRHADS